MAAIFVYGCSGLVTSPGRTGTEYVYSYRMEQPASDSVLQYQDDYIAINFSIDASAVTFQLTNRSDQQLSVAWDRVAIGINKRMYPVRNNTTFYSLGHATPQPLGVPPQGFVRETVIPWPHVNYAKGVWTERELFPVSDSGSPQIKRAIESAVGSEILLVLPMRIGKLVMDYSFVFKVAAVSPLSPGAVPPARERPPMPDAPMYELSIMQGYLPIIISAGILIAAVYFFSQKKEPTEGL
jgi:hypothetical protein